MDHRRQLHSPGAAGGAGDLALGFGNRLSQGLHERCLLRKDFVLENNNRTSSVLGVFSAGSGGDLFCRVQGKAWTLRSLGVLNETKSYGDCTGLW